MDAPADWASEHSFQSDDCTNGNASGDAFFRRTDGDAENHEHQNRGKNQFKNERLSRGTSGLCCA